MAIEETAYHGDFQQAYAAGAFAGLIGVLLASAIVEWLLPFVYNVGLGGFRFSVLSWVFLGGLVALEQTASKESEETEEKPGLVERHSR